MGKKFYICPVAKWCMLKRSMPHCIPHTKTKQCGGYDCRFNPTMFNLGCIPVKRSK
jgi:hypothetical protein